MEGVTRGRSIIRGEVTSIDGVVAFASVLIEAAPAPFPDVAALTDNDGRFSFAGVGPGTYRIVINAEGYGVVSVQIDVGDEDAFVRIEI